MTDIFEGVQYICQQKVKYICRSTAAAMRGGDSSHELQVRGKCLEGELEVKMGLKTENRRQHLNLIFQP